MLILDFEDQKTIENSHCSSEVNNLVFYDPLPEVDLPLVEILENPCPNYRFRFKSEQGVVACLYGENQTQKKKSFPKLRICNLKKDIWSGAEITVSCVTHDDHMVHPHMIMNSKRVGNTHVNCCCIKCFY